MHRAQAWHKRVELCAGKSVGGVAKTVARDQAARSHVHREAARGQQAMAGFGILALIAQFQPHIALYQFQRVDFAGGRAGIGGLTIGARVLQFRAKAQRPGVVFGSDVGAQRYHRVIGGAGRTELSVDRFDA